MGFFDKDFADKSRKWDEPTKSAGIRMPVSLWVAIRKEAAAQETTPSDLMRRVLEREFLK